MHACIKKYGTKVTHDFLISALDDAVLFLRVSRGEGIHDLRQACELFEKLIDRTAVRMRSFGSRVAKIA